MKRLLKLVFVDADGTPYNECVLPPRTARDLLVKNGIYKVYINHLPYPLTCFSYAEVARQSRAVIAKFDDADHKGHEIIITPEDDHAKG